MIEGSQVRAARALLKWKVEDLAKRAEVSPNTVVRFEADKGVNLATLKVIQRALEDAGILFIPENGGGVGVRFRYPRVPPQGEAPPGE
jgi:transcriptional regulator with XRE-family HTH domain